VATWKRTRKGVPVSEQNTEQQVQVRQVTDVQASWTEHERGEPGSFTIQLILDDGAEEYILLPTADDAKIMLKLFRSTDAVYFDLGNKVLIPSDVF
jgi:predicted aspartyl protease